MDDDLCAFIARQEPDTARPLLGLTVLVVEDSRFACEALRLMCLRSGARIRRADCLASARRHLQCYRPTVIIVDLGLPDGSGTDLIADLARLTPKVPVLLGTSGDVTAAAGVMAAGADGFLAKPYDSLAAFQQAILTALPPSTRPQHPVTAPDDRVRPDPLAFRDDLTHIAAVLGNRPDDATLGYIAQFLTGLARSAHDAPLEAAAKALSQDRHTHHPLLQVNSMVQDRLAADAPI